MLEWVNMRLYEKSRSLALALGLLSTEMGDKTETIGTDGFVLYVNERWLRAQFLKDSEALCEEVLHVLCHCMLRHPFRYEREKQKRSGTDLNKLHEAWEAESWELVDRILGRKSGGGSISQEARWYQDDHSLWEQHAWMTYFRALAASSGSGNGGQGAGEGTAGRSEQGLSKEIANGRISAEMQKKWQQAYEAAETNHSPGSKRAGTRQMSVTRSIALTSEKRCDYGDFLRRFATLREEGGLDMEQYDYGFYFWGMQQYGNVPLIEPLEYRERRKIEELVIAIDTSGSCSKELVRMFLEETRNILKEEDLFFRRFRLHIIQCDNQIQRDDRITSQEEMDWYLENLQVKGGGGTDFRPVFERIEELRRLELYRLKGILYFTDGYGIYPKAMPDYHVAFVFLKYRYDDIDVPGWAEKLVLDAGRPKGADYEY